jgi:hypothetical protein
MISSLSAEKNYSYDHQSRRQNWRVTAWCQKKGLPADIIDDHPYYEDILFLTQFQDEFESEYRTNAEYYNRVKKYWSLVVGDRVQLSCKAFAKFEHIAHECLIIRQQKQNQLNQIQRLRQQQAPAKSKNMDHDMMAKGSCSPQKLTHKGTNESAVEKSAVPWE